MSGIYIHVPFCKKACHYCNFHFSTSLLHRQGYIDAVKKEIALQSNYLNTPVSSIYFGGGTPSVLPAEQIEDILQKLTQTFDIDANAEITLEANPDDISKEKLQEWKGIGINRLSIGTQSFYDEDLTWMNRAHTANQAKNCITLAQSAGFDNLTIDLIYGTPTLPDDHWKNNVATALGLGVQHLSCYALTVEPDTALHKMILQHKLPPVDAEKQARHFEQLIEWMEAAQFEHYEISNFAKPGHRSKHNSSYWQGKHYLGLGPSAHSFNGSSRQWNIANNALYISALQNDVLSFEMETLTTAQQTNEYIMTSLRTIEGIALQKIENNFGKTVATQLLTAANPFLLNHQLIISNNYLKTTNAGKLLADGIASALFV